MLHCLRHTFAVIQWIMSNDIYEVKNLLGHTSVTTTEKYAQFNLDRLKQDFPSAYEVRLKVEKVRKNGINTQFKIQPIIQPTRVIQRGVVAEDKRDTHSNIIF